MPTIAVADIPVEEFALRESLQAVPDLAVESQRVFGNGLERFAERELFYGNVGNDNCRHYWSL